jgi:exopolyphosphatase/guanosine-5'-triphosphate,3'-diphosphate pyrophosphatase
MTSGRPSRLPDNPPKMRSVVKAVIDIGSNSIKLRVVRKDGGRLRTVLDITEPVRLGSGLASGVIGQETMLHGTDVVQKLTQLAEERGAKPRLVGTMALRSAKNAPDFVRMVRERTGLTVEVLSGEEEARLSWLGATWGLPWGTAAGDVAVFDTGGGSTEFIFGRGGQIEKTTSVPLGAVHLTDKFFGAAPVASSAVCAARQYIMDVMSSDGQIERGDGQQSLVVGLGGGVVAMACVKLALPFAPETIRGISLTKEDVDSQVKLYASLSLDRRKQIAGLPPKRADIILASACIVQCALEFLETEAFRVSISGLRHGLLLEMFKRTPR